MNEAPEKITINGREYDLEDATQLVEKAERYNELEGKLNTSLDKVYPEYTRTTQELKKAQQELAERNAELEAIQKKQATPEVPADVADIRKRAREIGLTDQDYLKEQGYVTKSEIDEIFSQKQNQQKLVENILSKADKLEREIDGSDGRIPFDQKAVLAYASAYQIDDLEDAYDQMNTRGNAKWKEAQIAKEEHSGLITLKGGGKKFPERIKVTDSNFKELWAEEFGTGE